MKRKIVTALLCCAISLSIAGCGGNAGQSTSSESKTFTESPTKPPTSTPTATPIPTEAINPITYVEPTFDYLFFPDSMRWNMALEEVKDTEDREVDRSIDYHSAYYLSYLTDPDVDQYANVTSIVYYFEDKILKARWCEFDEEKIHDYKELYEDIKNAVIEKYGACESENINWSDAAYQNDESKWNDAFRYGYVTIKTVWHVGDSAIIITWDYNKELSVATASLDVESKL